jgi:hypothetical protein
MAIEIFGNKWKRSRASRVECAVSTLNFAVSSTSFRTDNAWLGSGSATRRVGLGTLVGCKKKLANVNSLRFN